MIALFTDFGSHGPYLGQMEAVLRTRAPGCEVVNLLSDAPAGEPRLSAYLLAAFGRDLPAKTVFLCVVDPGVGSERRALVLEADGRWYVGPDNGLLNTVALHARERCWWVIEWRPQHLSSSFHGRDLFAPVAAAIAAGNAESMLRETLGPDLTAWPADLDRIAYIDHFGNAMVGRRWTSDLAGKRLRVAGQVLREADTFCSVAEGDAFWYKNSSGLVEIAVNRGRADKLLKLTRGMVVDFLDE